MEQGLTLERKTTVIRCGRSLYVSTSIGVLNVALTLHVLWDRMSKARYSSARVATGTDCGRRVSLPTLVPPLIPNLVLKVLPLN